MSNTAFTPDILCKATLAVLSSKKISKGKYKYFFPTEELIHTVSHFQDKFLAEVAPNPNGKYFNRKNALPNGLTPMEAAYMTYDKHRVRVLPVYDNANATQSWPYTEGWLGWQIECVVTR